MIVSDNPEKRLIGLLNVTIGISDQNPDNIRVNEASDLGLPFLKIAIKMRVLERDRCLCRQQFQDRDSSGGECVRSQCVFEEKNPGQLLLLDQRQAEDRLRLSIAQIIVRGEQVGFGGIVENHAFPRADDIADEGLGTGDPGDRLLAHRDFDLIAGRSRLGLNQIFIP